MKSMSAIIFKDIVIEMRNKESITSMLMFGVLVLVVFQFAFETINVERGLLAPGTLWVAFSFAAILGLNRSLAMEIDNDCLQGLLLAPISRGELEISGGGRNCLPRHARHRFDWHNPLDHIGQHANKRGDAAGTANTANGSRHHCFGGSDARSADR